MFRTSEKQIKFVEIASTWLLYLYHKKRIVIKENLAEIIMLFSLNLPYHYAWTVS